MDPFLIQIAIIFVPGMIWERIDAQCIQKLSPNQFEVIRRSFVFGLCAYIATYLGYSTLGLPFHVIELENNKALLSRDVVTEIGVASVTAFFLAIPYTWIINRSFHYRLFQYLKITKRYGTEDVWDFTFNSRNPDLKYIHLRDFDKKITYAGWVKYFSETDKIRELILSNAILYDFDGNKILESPNLYLARPMDDIDVEFPDSESNGEKR